MDEAGIDVQVLSQGPPGPESLQGSKAIQLARACNDELAGVVRQSGGRFAGFAVLPTSEPEEAAKELRRAVSELRLLGAMLNGTTGGAFHDERRFWPIFAEAERLNVPIYLHPAPPTKLIRDAYYSGFSPEVSSALGTSAWGWHVETGLHLVRLVLSGLFDAHPNLQLIVGHMGEAIPFMLDRLTDRLGPISRLERPFPDYFRSNVYYTTSAFFSMPPLRCLLDQVPLDHVMFGVDYPFSANKRATNFLGTVQLAPREKEMIAHANAERLFRF
jgi:predicted TIM-barrel fold metal-dependent hydrolase